MRSILTALAGVPLACLCCAPVHAQSPSSFLCVTSTDARPTIRADGQAELLGDLVVNCTGGTSTPDGSAAFATDLTLTFNTNVANRVSAGNFTDALLLIGEPHAEANPVPLLAQLASANTLVWHGVPLAASGPSGSLVLRFKNIRVYAADFGATTRDEVTGFIQASGVTFTPPQQALAIFHHDSVSPIPHFVELANTVSVVPSSLNFVVPAGSTAPVSQHLQITSSPPGIAWFATPLAPWLSVSPNAGVAPATVTVSVLPATLSAATVAQGTIDFTSAANELFIRVTALTDSGSPTLVVTPSSLSFSSTIALPTPQSQNLALTYTGSLPSAWTSTSSAAWLTAVPSSGGTPATVAIFVQPAGLAAASYIGLVTFTPQAGGSPVVVSVELTVASYTPALVASTQSLAFAYTAGSGGPISQFLQLTSPVPTIWTATTQASWLFVSPTTASTSTPSIATVSIQPAGLPAGAYSSSIIFTPQGGPPLVVPITLLVSPASNQPPSTVSVSPATSSGTNQSFLFQFSDPNGWHDLDIVNVLINTSLDGRHACYLAYVVQSNTLLLVDDAGDAGGPFAGSMVLNGSGSLSNSQCSIAGASSSASGNGNTLILSLSMSFPPAFAGNKVIYMAGRDSVQNNTGWQTMGVHDVQPDSSTFPKPVGMNPPSGSTTNATLTFTFQDAITGFNLQTGWALINTALDGRAACYIAYYRPGNQVYLIPDSGDGSQATSMILTGANSVSNSQCVVSAQGSSVTTVGALLMVTLNISFKPAFAGPKGVWMAVQTLNGTQTSPWEALAAWQVPL